MSELKMQAGDVATYLRHRLDRTDLRVTSLTRFPRGVSRETWFVDTESSVSKQGYVLRRDLPGRSICTAPLRFEYEIFNRLHGTAVPVARAIAYEDDPDWMIDGRPFYVRELVDGRWDVPHFTDMDPRYDELRIAAAKEHVGKLAALHNLDWERLGFGELMDRPASPAESAATAIDRLERKLREIQIEPVPVFTEAIGWLRDHVPKPSSRVCLLKGNNGLGEEIWHEGRIVAMSDWELASLGDPAYDFAWCQGFASVVVANRWSLEHLLEHYESVSGIHVEPAAIQYYKLIQALEGTVFTHNAALPVVSGENLLARLCWVSIEVHHSMQSTLANGMGLALQPPGTRR